MRGAAAQALGQIAPGERAGPVIDKLLPLLDDQRATCGAAAAQALGQIATGERAGAVIDKLLPLLGMLEDTRRTPQSKRSLRSDQPV